MAMEIGDAREGTGMAGEIAKALKELEPAYKVKKNKGWVLPDAIARAVVAHLLASGNCEPPA